MVKKMKKTQKKAAM